LQALRLFLGERTILWICQQLVSEAIHRTGRFIAQAAKSLL
jgi:hypothetical protein